MLGVDGHGRHNMLTSECAEIVTLDMELELVQVAQTLNNAQAAALQALHSVKRTKGESTRMRCFQMENECA